MMYDDPQTNNLAPEHGKCSPQLLTSLVSIFVVKGGDSKPAVFLSFGYQLRCQVGNRRRHMRGEGGGADAYMGTGAA